MISSQSFDLEKFVAAQASTYRLAESELAAGRKRTHWMWFIFPQIHGLGSSSMARHFAISGMAEAKAYLAHPVLGERLRHCTELAIAAGTKGVEEIFGYPDDLKFHSSMTLFAEADEQEESVFARALARFFDGRKDAATLARL